MLLLGVGRCFEDSPFLKAQALDTVNVRSWHGKRQAICGDGSVRPVSAGRLRRFTQNRGLEWDLLARHREHPQVLPRVETILRASQIDIDLRAEEIGNRGQHWHAYIRPRLSKAEWPKAQRHAVAPPLPQSGVSLGTTARQKYLSRVGMSLAGVAVSNPAQKARRPEADGGGEGQEGESDKSNDKSSRESAVGHGVAGARSPQQGNDGQAPQNVASRRGSIGDGTSDEEDEEEEEWIGRVGYDGRHRDTLELVENAQAIYRTVGGIAVLPWDTSQVRAVYVSQCIGGEMHVDDLVHVLKHLGVVSDACRVSAVATEVTPYSTLTFKELLSFLTRYRELEILDLRKLFADADLNGNGTLEVNEIVGLLRMLGYPVSEQMAFEVLDVCDVTKNQCIDFHEFEIMLHHLRATEGFPQEEVEQFRSNFHRLAWSSEAANGHQKAFVGRRRGGHVIKPRHEGWTSDVSVKRSTGHETIAAEEIWRLLFQLGYPVLEDELRHVLLEMDLDATVKVNVWGGLKIARAYHVKEFERSVALVKSLSGHGKDAERLKIEDLGIALGEIGYHVSEEAIFEALDSLGECAHEDSLSIYEWGSFLRAYRATRGFSEEEMQDLNTAFSQGPLGFKTSLGGTLDAERLGYALRWLGIPTTYQRQLRAIKECDFDGSGTISFDEFPKLVRRLFQMQAAWRRECYQAVADASRNAKGTTMNVTLFPKVVAEITGHLADTNKLNEALISAGLAVPEDSMPLWRKNGSFCDFERVYAIYHRAEIQDSRANAGYVKWELEDLRTTFSRHDLSGDGNIEQKELFALLATLFPTSTTSIENRDRVWGIFKRIDVDHNAKLDFREFLWLVREADEERHAAEQIKEVSVVAELGFSTEEVESFREVFASRPTVVKRLLDSAAKVMARTGESELAALAKQRPDGVTFVDFLRIARLLTPHGSQHRR